MQTKATVRNKVDEAVWRVGGPTKAANICGVSWYTVRQWRKKGFIPDGRCAVLLSEATREEFSVRDLAIKADEQPTGEPVETPTTSPVPKTRLHVVEAEEPAGEVALVSHRRAYAPPPRAMKGRVSRQEIFAAPSQPVLRVLMVGTQRA